MAWSTKQEPASLSLLSLRWNDSCIAGNKQGNIYDNPLANMEYVSVLQRNHLLRLGLNLSDMQQDKFQWAANNNTNMLPLDFPCAQFFKYQNWGKGDWEQGNGNFIVYFHENQDYLFADMAGTWDILIRLFTLDFVKVSISSFQFLRNIFYLILHRIVDVKVSLHTYNFCYNSNYRGIIMT